VAKLCAKALEYGIETEYMQHLIRRRNLVPEIPVLHLDSRLADQDLCSGETRDRKESGSCQVHWKSAGTVLAAAKAAGKNRTALWNLIKKHDLSPKQLC